MIRALRVTSWVVVAMSVVVALAACTGDDSSPGSSSSSSSSGGGSCPDDLPAACPATPPSYTKDVTPVIQAACTPCHATGGTASNRLLTDYVDLFRQRSGVLNQVHACRMPPSDGAPLSAAGRQTLQAWLVCGAPNN